MARLASRPGSMSCLAAIVAWSACAGGSETGNPAVPTEIALSVRSTDPDLVALNRGTGVDAGAGNVVLREAWIAFGEAAFLDDADCARFGELEVQGETLVIADLAHAGALLSIDARAEGHCGLVVPLPSRNAIVPTGAPSELSTHSIVLKGERADGTAFLLTHPEHDELELAAIGGMLEPLEHRLLLAFDVAIWMRDVELDAAVIGDDGIIHIDAQTNRALLDRFEENLECSLELYADADEDGAVSSGDDLLATCAPE